MIGLSNGARRRLITAGAALALFSAAGFSAVSPVVAQQARALGAAVNKVILCRTSTACSGGQNSGLGQGVLGSAVANNGVDGGTTNPSVTKKLGRSGVYGHDDSTDGGYLNVGVAGSSTNGFGMQATSLNGVGLRATSTNFSGAQATSTNGIGLEATSSNGISLSAYSPSSGQNGIGVNSFGGTIGVQGSSDFGIGTVGMSTSNVGIMGQSTNWTAIYATSIGGDAVDASTSNGYGVYAQSALATAVIASVGTGDPFEAVEAIGGTRDSSGYSIEAFDVALQPKFSVDNAGNVRLSGQLFSQGSCQQGCSPTRHVESYAPRESMPSMEDIGEGQLVAGTARVRLEPSFANVIDRHATYVVFVSPEGPSQGLYVTQKDATGFTVVENPGGHATIPFGYRIVAKPYGVAATRLPMTEDRHKATLPRHKLPARRHR